MGLKIPRGDGRRPRPARRPLAHALGHRLARAPVSLRARLHAPDHHRLVDARAAGLPVDPAPAGAARRRARGARGRGAHGHDPVPAARRKVPRHHHGDAARGARGLLRGLRHRRAEAGLCRHHGRGEAVCAWGGDEGGSGGVCQAEAGVKALVCGGWGYARRARGMMRVAGNG